VARTANYTFYVMPDPAFGEPKEWNRIVRVLDPLIGGLVALVLSGKVKGWEVTAGTGLDVNIAPGQGFMGIWLGETTATQTLTLPDNSTVNVYAVKKEVVKDVDPTAEDKADIEIQAEFQAVLSGEPAPSDSALLAEVVTSGGAISSVTDRRTILYRLEEHEHTGASGQPPQVDLSAEVTGLLPSANLADGAVTRAKITIAGASGTETVTLVPAGGSVDVEVDHSATVVFHFGAGVPELTCQTTDAEVILLGDGMTNGSFRARVTNNATVDQDVTFTWTRRGIA